MAPVKKIKQIVIDSGAFLKNLPIWEYGEEFYSVRAVIQEIRDKQAKEFVNSLPVQINFREPSAASIKFINEFTKKIGEYNSLSLTDVKVLALTYELETEAKGGADHLRSEPVQRRSETQTSRPPALRQNDGFYYPSNQKKNQTSGQEANDSPTISGNPEKESETDTQKCEHDIKEIIYINDINILDCFLSTVNFLNGKKIGGKDLNIFSRLVKRYTYLRSVKKIFCELQSTKEKDFFERFCINHYSVFSNIVVRPKFCAHPEKCDDSSECQNIQEKCAHPKKCRTYDTCIHISQCAHRLNVNKDLLNESKGSSDNLIAPDDMRNSECNNYCDYENFTFLEWKFLEAARRFYEFCGKRIYFKIWFFNVLRYFKFREFHIEDGFQENEELIKETLRKLRQFDENLQEIESTTSIVELSGLQGSEDYANISAASVEPPSVIEAGVASLSINDQSNNEEENTEDNDDSDDDDGWITPSNVHKIKEKHNSICEKDYKDVEVACISSDFSMQNTLLHIGLSVIGVDGKLIKSLRMYILRCFVCKTECSDFQKMFCYKCGYKSLKKVSYTLNPDGTKHIWISKRPINKRGMKYSLPAPKGGKHAINPISCADQRVPDMRPSKKSLQRNDPLSDDFMSRSDTPFSNKDLSSKAAQLGITCHMSNHRGTFYWEKKNPNDPGRNVKKRRC